VDTQQLDDLADQMLGRTVTWKVLKRLAHAQPSSRLSRARPSIRSEPVLGPSPS
jgi:hypothetical protein